MSILNFLETLCMYPKIRPQVDKKYKLTDWISRTAWGALCADRHVVCHLL